MTRELFKLGQKFNSFQMEIYPRKIDLFRDSPSIIQLLPGVGQKKAKEIIELRKTTSSTDEIIGKLGLNKHQKDWDELLDHEEEK